VEQIDIGGPTLLRSAAKNHQQVIVVVRPERYPELLAVLARGEQLQPAFRRRLAAEAFAHTAAYDAQIAGWLNTEQDFPLELTLAGRRTLPLRYGENPHQSAAFYRTGFKAEGLGALEQLQGDDLSFNNLQDLASGYQLVGEYSKPTVAIIKHNNPCGLASAEELSQAYNLALECDRTSAFGGVVALNRSVDVETAEQIVKIFTEVVVAPSVEPQARSLLESKPKLRVVEVELGSRPGLDVRTVPGGLLVQSWDKAGWDRNACQVATHRSPTEKEWEQLEFAWLAAKHVKSNAIVLAWDWRTIGVGGGQTSRVEAVQIAVAKAGEQSRGSVMASDAFFPFPDALQVGIEAGITAVVQPGGSIHDQDSIRLADEHQIAMVMTGQRHFRH
ncbi:MAG: bifunctional phosphoribosylaminoimidazolecarboxamide formyltransferase/IMP cyclohydrolase, partial [Candidatus Dormibacteraceae bacterium]